MIKDLAKKLLERRLRSGESDRSKHLDPTERVERELKRRAKERVGIDDSGSGSRGTKEKLLRTLYRKLK